MRLPISRWTPVMLMRDEDDRPVLFMGGHRGYLISSPEHLDELQHFFGWGSNNGHLSKIIFVFGSSCFGVGWWLDDVIWAINAGLAGMIWGRVLVSAVWANRFVSRNDEQLTAVHCETMARPPFRSISRTAAKIQLGVVSALTVLWLCSMPMFFHRNPFFGGGCLFIFSALTWFFSAGPLAVLRNKSDVPPNKRDE